MPDPNIIPVLLLAQKALQENKPEKVLAVIQAFEKNTSELSLECTLLLAKAEYLLGHYTIAENLYKKLIQQSNTSDNMLIYQELLSLSCNTSVIYECIDTIIDKNTVDSYMLLWTDHNELYGVSAFSEEINTYIITALLKRKTLPYLASQDDKAFMNIISLLENTMAMQTIHPESSKRKVLLKKISKFIQKLLHLYNNEFLSVHKKEKLKVGVFLTRLGIKNFQSIIHNVFSGFDENQFELVLFTRSVYKPLTDFLEQYFHKILFYDPPSGKQMQSFYHFVSQEQCDILLAENVLFPELRLLFHQRIAPIQCNILDSFFPTGGEYCDYYLLFAEKDVYKKWPNLLYKHEKYTIFDEIYIAPYVNDAIEKPRPWDLSRVGLPQGAEYIFYSQRPERIRKEDDIIFETLLAKNSQLYIILTPPHPSSQKYLNIILNRFNEKFPQYTNRILLPNRYLTHGEFLYLAQQAAIALGSYKAEQGVISLMTVLSQGTPVVLGCEYARVHSSFSSLVYHKIGIKGLLASNEHEYIQIVQELLDNPTRRKTLSQKIKTNVNRIYNQKNMSQALQLFLQQAHARTVQGLPPEIWEHGKFIENLQNS